MHTNVEQDALHPIHAGWPFRGVGRSSVSLFSVTYTGGHALVLHLLQVVISLVTSLRVERIWWVIKTTLKVLQMRRCSEIVTCKAATREARWI